jgi:hypothetical protein
LSETVFPSTCPVPEHFEHQTVQYAPLYHMRKHSSEKGTKKAIPRRFRRGMGRTSSNFWAKDPRQEVAQVKLRPDGGGR